MSIDIPPPADFRTFPGNRAIVLRNIRCAYCGDRLTRETTTRDHVIGRRSVPKGKLGGLPPLQVDLVSEAPGRSLRSREDVPLAETDDLLFQPPP